MVLSSKKATRHRCIIWAAVEIIINKPVAGRQTVPPRYYSRLVKLIKTWPVDMGGLGLGGPNKTCRADRVKQWPQLRSRTTVAKSAIILRQ